MYKLKKVSEIVVITANLDAMLDLFCNYGGWKLVEKADCKSATMSVQIANMDEQTLGEICNLAPNSLGFVIPERREALIQFMDVAYGRIRFIEVDTNQKPMRPASKLWDTGGILDIDIRTHDIYEVYNELLNRGWSAAAVPMPLPIDDFVIDECLMTNADSMMIALAKRYQPPMELPENKKLASHIYLSAMTVQNLEASTDFFVNKLGFQLANDTLKVQFPANSPNNFGVPHSFSDQFEINLSIYSSDGTRDTMVECIESKGLLGNNYADNCQPPNRGIYCYRIEVENIENYLAFIKNNDINSSLNTQNWSGIGEVKTFSVVTPDGAAVVFFELI